MPKNVGLDGRHRDKNGEISKKHGNTLISTLRQTYGAGFAQGRSGGEKLKDVLHDLDEPSLTHLINDMRGRCGRHGRQANGAALGGGLAKSWF